MKLQLFVFRFPVVVAAVLGIGFTGCILSDDVDQFEFQLPEKTYSINAAELGVSTETSIPCTPGEQTCESVDSSLTCDGPKEVCVLSETAVFPTLACGQEDICGHFGNAVFCAQDSGACQAETVIELSTAINLADEVEELKEVGNLNFTKVNLESFYFDVQINSLGVATPELGVYVAQNSVGSLDFDDNYTVTTAGVSRIGTIPSMEADFTGRKDAILTAQGRSVLEDKIKNPEVTFKLFVAGPWVLAPGDPLPDVQAGMLQVVVSGTAVAETEL
jgi:hypothetical protein